MKIVRTSAPALAFDPYGDVWVFIGTGDRNRPTSSSANRFYGIKDNTGMANGSTLTEANLVVEFASNPLISVNYDCHIAQFYFL